MIPQLPEVATDAQTLQYCTDHCMETPVACQEVGDPRFEDGSE